MNQRNGGLALPGQVNIGVVVHPGPYAQPIVVAVPKSNGIEAHVWGGTSQLQDASVRIAAGIMSGLTTIPDNADVVAAAAVSIAQAVLMRVAEVSQPTGEQS